MRSIINQKESPAKLSGHDRKFYKNDMKEAFCIFGIKLMQVRIFMSCYGTKEKIILFLA